MAAESPLEGEEVVVLVRDAQAGDVVAMSALMDRLAPFVGRICGPIALDQGPDAAQEALIQIFSDLRGLREPRALRGWARRIATREAVRHVERVRARLRSSVETDVLRAPGSGARDAEVRDTLERLRPSERAILVLRDVEGLGEAEAASELDVARGTAKSRLSRARAAFIARWRE